MPNTFTATGTLSLAPKSEKLTPYTEKLKPGGWDSRMLHLRLTTDKGPVFLTLKGFKKNDDSNEIFKFETINGTTSKTAIPFKERKDPKWIKKVRRTQRLTIDTETDLNRRQLLREASKKDILTANDLETLGLSSKEDVQSELAKSYSKTFEFLSEWDFIEKLHSLLEAGFFKNLTVTVRGNINVSIFNNKYYFNYEPTSVYAARDTDAKVCECAVLFYYGNDVFELAEDGNSINLKGYLQYYDQGLKAKQYAPYDILCQLDKNLDAEKKQKKINYLKRRFDVNGQYAKIMGLIVENVNYAPEVELTLNDLSDEEKEAIEMGDTTLEKVLGSKKRTARGDFLKANIYKGVMPVYAAQAVESNVTIAELTGQAPEDDDLPF